MKTLSLFEKLRSAVSGAGASGAANTLRSGSGAGAGTGSAGPAEVELVLGIDLGTSCTKVVIGDMGWRNIAWAVPYDASRPGIAAYLHPTRFGRESNLKMRLMDEPGDPHLQELTAACLAGVIGRALVWFANNAAGPYAGRRLRWTLNLGYPGKSLEASGLKEAYERVARDAVRTAVPAGDAMHGAAAGDAAMRTELYPEIAAQLAGYIRSPYRKLGNLLLVDVGAGTLDVSTLILGPAAAEDLVSFQACKVEDLGALRLHQRRMEAAEAVAPGCVGGVLADYQDGSAALPDVLEEFVQQPTHGIRQAFDAAGRKFGESVLETIEGCFALFRKRLRDSHELSGFDPVGRSIRLMVTGGGSRSGFYRRLFQNSLEGALLRYSRWADDAARRTASGQGVVQETLPVLAGIQNLPASLHSDSDRLSVAHGLAFGGSHLMRVMCAPESVFGGARPAEKAMQLAA